MLGQEVEHKYCTNTPWLLSYQQPPPLSMLWSRLWGPCLFCVRLERVSISSLQVCLFFYWNVDVKKWVHGDNKR